MERFKRFNKHRTDQKQNSKNFFEKEENSKNIYSNVIRNSNHKRRNNFKEISPKKLILTNHNSKNKNSNKRTYKKRANLIHEKIQILQFAKRNINEENFKNDDNNKEMRNRIMITDNENNYKDLNSQETTKNNNYLFKSLKIEEDEINPNEIKKNIDLNDKYIKKIPVKSFSNSVEKKQNIKKYETSTFFYKQTKNNIINKNNNEKYNNNTYNYEKEIKETSNEKTDNNNKMDIIGYKTGFVYRNKKMKDKLSFGDSGKNSPKNKKSYTFNLAKPNNNNKSIKNMDLLIEPQNNIKEVKDEYESDNNDIFIDKEKELNNIYIPKKIPHLIRGNSQEDIKILDNVNYARSNTAFKDRYKSYNKTNNFSNNNNINININNNIKIISYNKKKPFWKLDNKERNKDIIEQNFEDERFDIFKENISDISSIESISNIESETTENNNKLNVYLNNIYKTKAIYHPKLYKKKESNIISDNPTPNPEPSVGANNNQYSINTVNTPNSNINIKNSRNISVPHFVFKKRITKDISDYNNNQPNINNNLQIKNIKNTMAILKVANNPKDNEPKFEEFVILNSKLKNIIDGIETNSLIINKLCFDFINNFYQSSILYSIEKLFENKNLKIIKSYLRYLVFSIILLYNYCIDSIIEENDKFLIQEVFSLNLQNLMYLYEYIISKVKSKNLWAIIIKDIIHNFKRQKKNKFSSNTNLYYQSVFDKTKNNTNFIRQILNRVFIDKNRTNETFFKELDDKSFFEIKNFFNTNIFINNNIYGYVYPFSLFNNISKEFIQEKPFFNKKDKSKKYTLVIGLEETLINLELEDESESKGTLKLRPGVITFLKEIKNYYEIIIFSLSEKKIVEYLINSIEKRNSFFSYRLFRENFKIVNEEFVIDLNQIERPLDKIIIVSNIPQIYQYNKENAINIKGYWKEDLDDSILNKLLTILKEIAREEEDNIPNLLLKYKDDIIKNVTIGSINY